MIKTCETCGKSFNVQQWQISKRFCSPACFAQTRITKVEKICEACGKPYLVNKARANITRHCSKACQTTKIELTCVLCGKPFYEKQSHAHYRRTCSKSCQAKLRAQEGRSPNQGRKITDTEKQLLSEKSRQFFENNPEKHNWYVDGSYAKGKLRRGPTWQQQREAARARDGYTCRMCNITETQLGKQLSVHHRTPYRLFASSDDANKLENLICLCQSCHWKAEHHPELLDTIM